MSRTLVWDAAPGETRCLLLEHGAPVELHLIRSVAEPQRARAGSQHNARLVSRLGNGRGLIKLDSGEEALLHPVPQMAEGAALSVIITRESLPEPGQWKRALARPADGDAPPPLAGLPAHLAEVDEVICATPLPLPPALAHTPHRIDMALVADADIDVLVEAARTGLIDFPGGALSIERTRAMTMIDVDGSLAPLALNCAAAAAIGRALRLFQITGPIGIDFVGMASKADRQAVDAALGAALAPLGPLERTALNGFGFAQIIRPRNGPCVPEQLCGTTPGRLSVESQALALLREAARSTGIGPRTLTARPVVIDLLRRWTDVVAEVERWTGAPLNLVSDAGVQGYGHVHVTPA